MYKTGLVQITLKLTLLITFWVFLHTTLKLFHELVKRKVVFRHLYGFCCFQAVLHHVKFSSRKILERFCKSWGTGIFISFFRTEIMCLCVCMLCRPVKCMYRLYSGNCNTKKNYVFNFLIVYCRSFQSSVLQVFSSWNKIQLSSEIPAVRMVKCCRAE